MVSSKFTLVGQIKGPPPTKVKGGPHQPRRHDEVTTTSSEWGREAPYIIEKGHPYSLGAEVMTSLPLK